MRHHADGDDFLLIAENVAEERVLENAYWKLVMLEGSGAAPEVRDAMSTEAGTGYLALERVAGIFDRSAAPATAELDFLWGCVELLDTLRKFGIMHGDLTAKNVLVRDNRPVACDFQESTSRIEPPHPDHRPEGDAYWLWRAAVEITGDQDRRFRRWLAVRDRVRGHVVDYGCGSGWTLGMAYADGHTEPAMLTGIDADFTYEDYYRLGRWGGWPERADIMEVEPGSFGHGTAIVFSVVGHLIDRFAGKAVQRWLGALAEAHDNVLVELHYAGDGPGPAWLPDHAAAEDWLLQAAPNIDRLVTIPVHGRDAARTVWELRS